MYGLREALTLICKEGLESVITRHQKSSAALQSALINLGFQLYVRNVDHRLPTITSVKLSRDMDWKKIVEFAANEYDAFLLYIQYIYSFIYYLFLISMFHFSFLPYVCVCAVAFFFFIIQKLLKYK